MNKICNKLNSLIFVIALALIIFLTVDSFISTAYMNYSSAETTIYKLDNIPITLFCLIIFILVLLFLKRKLVKYDCKKITIILLLIHIGLSVAFIFVAQGTVNSFADSEIVYNIALDFRNHNYDSLKHLGYLYRYPFQLGLVLFENFLLNIFNNHAIIAFQIISALLSSISCYYLIKIFNLITNEKYKNSLLIPLLIFGCFNIIIYNCFIYGNSLSFSLYIFATYFWILYLKRGTKYIKNMILSLLLFSISYFIKSTAILPVIMILIVTLIDFFKTKNKKVLIYITLLILTFSLPFKFTQSYYQYKSGYNKSAGIPKIGWVVMGTMKDKNVSRSEGWYNAWQVDTYYKVNADKNKYIAIAKNEIAKNIKTFILTPKYTVKFFYKKISSQWNNPTYQSLWSINPKGKSRFIYSLYKGSLNKKYYSYMNIYQTIIFFGALLYLIYNNTSDYFKLSFFILFIGGFIFYTFWEAKSQYVFQYFLILVPYSGAGWHELINKLVKVKKDLV